MFCKICGNELNEKAVICPKCGCEVEEKTPVKVKKSTSNGISAYKVLKYISATLLILTLAFTSAFTSCVGAMSVISSILFAFLGFVCSVITFALSFSGENRKTGFSSYVMFIASITILFFPIFFAW